MIFLYIKKKTFPLNNLIFFNKEGFPHNFSYNQDTESYEGKILFDENSDQTFKTQSLHIFESVDPINFDINADFVKLEYNNNSGLTLAGQTNFQNQQLTNIIKVNESDEFYSKWIYGTDFHKKFPAGTVISFSGVTDPDFSDDQYFTVLDIKKNAFLIITKTSNDVFNFTFITGSTVSSLNMISINEYNRNLSGETFFQNLETNENFSIVNSYTNDQIVSVKQSGVTYSYLNDIKLNGVTNNIFTLSIQLFTERPKIMQGDVTYTNLGLLEGELLLGKSAIALAPESYIDKNGDTQYNYKDIIFQDNLGLALFSGFTFKVTGLVDTIFVANKKITFKQYYQVTNSYSNTSTLSNTNKWNTLQFDGILNIKTGDIISLSGSGKMNGRDFNITNVSYNDTSKITTMFTPGYIIDETGYTYSIIQKLQSHQIKSVYVEPSSTDITNFNNIPVRDAYCYLTSSILSLSQNYISGNTSGNTESNTIDTFINKYKPTLYQYGIDVYHSIKNNFDYLSVESLYGTKTKYFYASGFTNNVKITDDFTLTTNGLTKKYDIITNEKLINENTNRSSDNLYQNNVSTEIVLYLNSDTDGFGFRVTLNGNKYYTNFVSDSQSTINNFITTWSSIFSGNGFTIYSGYSTAYTGYTLNIMSDVDIWDLEVVTNILSSYKITERQRNRSIVLSGNEIRSLSTNLFNLNLATGMILKIAGSNYSENNKEYNIIRLTESVIGVSYQGVFTSESSISIQGKTREFIRKPRGEYYRDIYLRAYWQIPYDEPIDDSIFFYDISGTQLVPYNNNPELIYTGPTPLIDSQVNNVVFLNTEANMDLTKVNNPKFQQTVFDELTFKLEQLDSSTSYNWIPEPLEIFIGYNATEEGVNTRTLKIDLIEKFENNTNYFAYTGYTNSGSSISIPNFIFDGVTLDYKAPADFNFISYGFKKDQLIKIYFKDQSKYNQRIFENNLTYKILNLSRTKITIDSGYTYQTDGVETGTTYSSGFTYFNSTGSTFFFKIEVQPKEILSCPLYGQTEIEDIRYKVNLNNLGVQSEDDVYEILYDSDIQDNAIDFTLFNRKRKEMLVEFREIYDYIGSYKSLINAINYFGYNSLYLYEYYRNIDQASSLFNKLHKVLIPDIFDNTVQGWNEMDFIAGKYQNQQTWKKTNLFNLAYRITDEDGNNVLIYSLEDVQYKLTKLKNWLRKNIIPISANLLDITGVADTNQTLYQDYDESNQTQKSVIERNSTVVNFNYTATLNFESDYLITVNFYIMSGATGTTIDYNEVPTSYSVKIKTFCLSGTSYSPTEILVPVQYFKLSKQDLKPFSFNLNKYIDPYIYIETTTYDNDGSGLGYVNNKMFYYDEPRNYWLVNNNFDLTKMKYWQTTEYINNTPQKWVNVDIYDNSTAVDSSVETIVKLNSLTNSYTSKISTNNTNANK